MVFLGAAFFLVVWGSSRLISRPGPVDFHLLTVIEMDVSATRQWIVQAPAGGGDPRILTEDFRTAGSISLAYDGQHFLFSGEKFPDGDRGIWEMKVGGSAARWITGGNGDPDQPRYLPDGRILYRDAPSIRDRGPRGPRSLFSCLPDGTDSRRLTFGDYRDRQPAVLDDGRVRFVRYPLRPGDRTPPVPLAIHPDGTGLLPDTREPDSQPETGWVSVTIGTKEYLVQEELVGAVRPIPPVLTSVVDRRQTSGTLLCLNVYESRLEAVSRLAPGSIDRVRLMRAERDQEARADGGEVLAEALVHSDGSFFVEVPADIPLRMDLLGKNGETVASLKRAIWVRPNENRGCVGCHESPEMSPENRVPLALAGSRGGADAD